MNATQGALLLGVAGLLALALWLGRRASAERAATGLPQGEIIAADMGAWEEGQPLHAPRYGLVGKPDYLLRVGRHVIPVEVKPSRRATTPYEADVMQLGAYALLVEEDLGARPPYGLLRYREHTFRLPNDDALRRAVLATLAAMRRDLAAPPDGDGPPRSHDEPTRCRFCGHRAHCTKSLVD
jgi:CRISPR-associated exonuclease Cas4